MRKVEATFDLRTSEVVDTINCTAKIEDGKCAIQFTGTAGNPIIKILREPPPKVKHK